jgi:hypothetical protein
MKALRCVCFVRRFVVATYSSFVARSLVGKCVQCSRWLLCFAPSGCLDDLYMTAEPCCVCVSCFKVHDLGRAKWSCRPCCVPAFGRVSISLSSCGHLTLVVASRGAPRGAGTALGLINRRLLTIRTPLSYFYELGFGLG